METVLLPLKKQAGKQWNGKGSYTIVLKTSGRLALAIHDCQYPSDLSRRSYGR